MNTEQKIALARIKLAHHIDVLADAALQNIKYHAQSVKTQLIKRWQHENRSAGQRRRYASLKCE